MKKIIFTGYSMVTGGIEKSLLLLLNTLAKEKKYDITLLLEHKEGEYLKDLDPSIKIIVYTPSENRFLILRRAINLCKRKLFEYQHREPFDAGISYTTYSLTGSFATRTCSKNAILWGHTNYTVLFGNQEGARHFFEKIQADQFRKIVFVSEDAKKSFLEIFPEQKDKTMVCNNLTNIEEMQKLGEEQLDVQRQAGITTFIHVGRHTEEDKKISRLLEAAKKLKEDCIPFRLLLVGGGRDDSQYQEYVKKEGLDKQVVFCGMQENPYPYYKIADCMVLTSEYEGYPMVYKEAFAFNVPIITTEVSDSKKLIEGKYGYVVGKNAEEIYLAMKRMVKEGYTIKEKIDLKKENENIIQTIEKLIEGE